MKIEKLIIPILFIVLLLLVIVAPYNDSFTVGDIIYINEVMASNKSTYPNKIGKYYDYIELYNNTDEDIDLEGYYLSDNNGNTRKYKLPKAIIKAKGYKVIFASGLDKVDGEEIHTNFKISSNGEMLILSDKDGKVINKINVNKTASDTSYGYDGKSYVYYYSGTPNAKNEGETSKTPIKDVSAEATISINEYILDNVDVVKSSDGKYYNMIELYNNTARDINIGGYHLTNEDKVLDKYTLPEAIIKANDYLVIYMNSEAKVEGEVHVSFTLENKEEDLLLTDKNKKVIDRIKTVKLDRNVTSGKYNNTWFLYKESSFGKANTNNYIKDSNKKDLIISEVAAINPEAIEIKNVSDKVINLSEYSIGDKSGKTYKLGNVNLNPNSYYSLQSSTFKFGIGTEKEIIYLYKGSFIEDSLSLGKLRTGISVGINNKNEKVYYTSTSFGKENSASYYKGYAMEPVFTSDTTYVASGTKIELSSPDGGTIYYTTDGNFPTKNSTKYTGPITITKNTVIKAINTKDGYLESDTVARTYLTGRKHTIPVVSMTGNPNSFYGSNGLLSNWKAVQYKKINIEYYEADGSYGTSFPAEVKLSGNIGGSRDKSQKAMTVYLRKIYGINTINYPMIKDSENTEYSSFMLRNGGEDYLNVHIFDAGLQKLLVGQMDLDMQDYQPVALYINGSYYGISNLRDKMNSDYAANKFDVDKDKMNVIKYSVANKGSYSNFNKLVQYIKSHDCSRKDVYEYLKTQIDMQEVVNYWIVQSFFGNTDLGNVKYWNSDKTGWRYMLYDIDWAIYYSNRAYNYPIANVKVPAATYHFASIDIVRSLYRNAEFRALYLSTFGKHLNSTFKPDRFNKIIDELAKEIEDEVPYHSQRWSGTNSSLGSVTTWKRNIENFKNRYKARYNYVKSSIRTNFSMSNAEYTKYFG